VISAIAAGSNDSDEYTDGVACASVTPDENTHPRTGGPECVTYVEVLKKNTEFFGRQETRRPNSISDPQQR